MIKSFYLMQEFNPHFRAFHWIARPKDHPLILKPRRIDKLVRSRGLECVQVDAFGRKNLVLLWDPNVKYHHPNNLLFELLGEQIHSWAWLVDPHSMVLAFRLVVGDLDRHKRAAIKEFMTVCYPEVPYTLTDNTVVIANENVAAHLKLAFG